MCNFCSWIETNELDKEGNPRVYFLTGRQIFHTDKGVKLQEWAKSPDDLVGHGAVRFFYGLEQDQGTNKERDNFKTPHNFPEEIVRAIKQSDMIGLPLPKGLLLQPLYDKYQADRKSLDDKYQADLQPLYDKYQADRKHKYQADLQPLYDKYWALFAIPKNRSPQWR